MGRAAEFVSFAALFMLAALLLIAVGQPLFTDDTWWHLALGRAYAQVGPWLTRDPLLFTAPGPPVPAAWLADLLLHATQHFGGFAALRTLHVAVVATTVSLTWSLLARASGSRLLASLGTAVFICLSAYRLVQLRPHLLTILASLLLYRTLFADVATPSVRRVAISTVLLAVWANAHAAFVLGPALIGVGLIGVVLGEAQQPASQRNFASPRIRRIALALVLGSAATCLNPEGIEPHTAYLIAGHETPSLARVGDEWSPIDLFVQPRVGELPSPLGWFLLWLLLGATAATLAASFARWRTTGKHALTQMEVGVLGFALVALAASLLAVRFLWLSVFPLLFLAAWSCRDVARPVRQHPLAQWSIAAAIVALVPAFFLAGDWPIISRGISNSWQDYSRDYPPEKYHAHAIWLLDDAALEGNLFAEYHLGGFAGYWLAPRMRAFVNGSLNVSKDAIDSNLPIRERRGAVGGESFAELLERQRVDVFVGIRLPRARSGTRPWFHTTAHLEGERDWLPVFRNMTSSVYIRNDAANRDNLERVEAYYRGQGIAFDPVRGFDPGVVIARSQAWAIEHGLLPQYHAVLIEAVNDRSSHDHLPSLALLSSVYSALGLYERSIEIDQKLIRIRPSATLARRRMVWCLLRSRRYADARAAAKALAAYAPADALSRQIVAVARATETKPHSGDLDGWIARLPVFSAAQASRLRASAARPEVRPSRESAR